MSESAPLCGGGDGRTGLACSSSAGSLRGVSAGDPLWFQPAASPRASWAQQSMVVRTPALAGSGWELAQPRWGLGLLSVRLARRWSCVVCGPFLLDTLCPTRGRPHRRSSFPAGPTRERPKSRFPSMGCLMRHRQTSLRLRVAFHSPDLPWQYWFGFGLWHCMSLAFNPL